MANRPSRASLARLTVGLAALAFPLIATGAAQAAIAGATPATTSLRPDLRAATINPSGGSTEVSVCFDKTLSSAAAPPAAAFHLVGYRASNSQDATGGALAPKVDPTNTNCVLVTFPATVGDLTLFTTVSVDAGAVTANSTGQTNLADSTTLAGSTTHAGTTGVSTGPNLVGVLAPTGTNLVTNSLTFVFDKAVSTTAPLATGPDSARFFYIDGAGTLCSGAAAPGGVLSGAGSTTVTVTFTAPCSGGGTSLVSGAVRAGVFGNPGGASVATANDAGSTNPDQSVVLPSAPNNGQTLKPDLVSATLNADNDSITYTFDKNVIVSGTGAGTFRAELATGQSIPSTGATGSGTTSVTARFGGTLSVQAEFGVIGWAFPGAVLAADNPTTGTSVPGSANIGGNAGAFARAFTTGPDAFGVTMNKATGLVTVNLDDRLKTDTPALIHLYDTSGNLIAAPTPVVSFNSSAAPGPQAVALQYPASALTNAGSIQFLQSAFSEPAGTLPGVFVALDAANIQQITSPVASGAILQGYKAYKAHAKKAHKHTTKHTTKH